MFMALAVGQMKQVEDCRIPLCWSPGVGGDTMHETFSEGRLALFEYPPCVVHTNQSTVPYSVS